MDIQAINISQGVVLTDSGVVLPIASYIDDQGDECESSANVVAVVVQGLDGYWYSLLTADYESVTVH